MEDFVFLILNLWNALCLAVYLNYALLKSSTQEGPAADKSKPSQDFAILKLPFVEKDGIEDFFTKVVLEKDQKMRYDNFNAMLCAIEIDSGRSDRITKLVTFHGAIRNAYKEKYPELYSQITVALIDLSDLFIALLSSRAEKLQNADQSQPSSNPSSGAAEMLGAGPKGPENSPAK